MKTAARAPRCSETGQVLVLFTLAIATIMGFVALTIDVGLILHERRGMQNAADAAALAAVQDLPTSPATAVVAAHKWAADNGYGPSSGATVTVNTPYNGDTASVEVIIEQDTPYVFARALGFNSVSVHARAVAVRDPGYGYAIFSYNSGCNAPNDLDMSGADFDIQGDIHTNGDLKLSSSDILADGSVTYTCDPPLVSGSNVDASDGFESSAYEDWPIIYDYNDFLPCTFNSGGDMTITKQDTQYWVNDDPNTGTLKPGVYCANGDITVWGDASGTVTFVSKKTVSFTGGSFDLDAYELNVLAYSSFEPKNQTLSAIKVNATSFTWTGILMAPFGEIQFSAKNADSDSGSIMGATVKISLSGGSITAPIDPDKWGPPRLVE